MENEEKGGRRECEDNIGGRKHILCTKTATVTATTTCREEYGKGGGRGGEMTKVTLSQEYVVGVYSSNVA